MNGGTIVHVVDDDAGVRHGIQSLLEAACFTVAGYESAEQFLESVAPDQSGCVIADLDLPGMSGVDLQIQLQSAGNRIPVIIITAHADITAALQCMKLGAVDLLEKPFDPALLLDAVRSAVVIDIESREKRADQESRRRHFSGLTSRERELLRLIVTGKSNKQIARDLNIAFKTVTNHRANLMSKTKATNAADLTRMALAAGVLPV